jgi:hypothetical protein
VRAIVLILAAMLPPPAGAQQVVTSPAPDRVAVTVYRNPERGLEPMNLNWLGGYALISETRRVRIPAGSSELRFEGVTSGIVPQSAILTGLGSAVLEKNRDARLLSPGSLLDASLGERLTLRRTSRATGVVREQDAVVRATADGIVVQTEAGIEALRCTGIPETLLAPSVPAGLSNKPTLSVRVRSPEPVERDVTLSYITNNFDWQADYIAELSPAGDSISLFGWLTMANGDITGLRDANTQAVAGKLNRERVWVDPGEAKPIIINCWPQGTTSDIPEAQPVTVQSTPPVAADPTPAADPLAATPEAAPTEAPAATTEASDPAPVAAKPVKRSARVTAKQAAPSRTIATRSATTRPAPAPTPAADPVQVMATKPAAQPIVDMNAEQPKPAATADAQPSKTDNTVPIAAGGALAVLALGGAAIAMTRRRRRKEDEEVWVEEEPVEHLAEPAPVVTRHDPVSNEQPLIVAPSAFAWGNERAATTAPAASAEPVVEQDDRMPGESWVQRAHRGPTPNNPSVSLRNRLKRAAFFDQRERDVAAGRAEPVEMDAGLPEAMVEEQERERDFA